LLTSTFGQTLEDNLAAAVTYFRNHQHQMNYALYRKRHYPIGSGVTEAACKTLIKQRLCCSGMRWKEKGAAAILRGCFKSLSESTIMLPA
jgi:hypothetical protein